MCIQVLLDGGVGPSQGDFGRVGDCSEVEQVTRASTSFSEAGRRGVASTLVGETSLSGGGDASPNTPSPYPASSNHIHFEGGSSTGFGILLRAPGVDSRAIVSIERRYPRSIPEDDTISLKCGGAAGTVMLRASSMLHLSRKSFTLMEILTVTAIFGIMVMAITPAVFSTAARGRAADCSVHLRTIQSAKAAFLFNNMGRTTVSTNNADELAEYRACFVDGIIPTKCPSNPEGTGGNARFTDDLDSDTVCPNNCPEGGDIADYPLEVRVGPDGEWYRNGYHDIYKKK